MTLSGRFASSSPGGGNNADRRQWRKQGAATRVRSTLGKPGRFCGKCKVPGPAHK